MKERKGESENREFKKGDKEKRSSKENFRTDREKINRSSEKNEDILEQFLQEKVFKNIKEQSKNSFVNSNKYNISINAGTMNRLKKAMKNDFEKYINQREYEKAERNREYENERYNEFEL